MPVDKEAGPVMLGEHSDRPQVGQGVGDFERVVVELGRPRPDLKGVRSMNEQAQWLNRRS